MLLQLHVGCLKGQQDHRELMLDHGVELISVDDSSCAQHLTGLHGCGQPMCHIPSSTPDAAALLRMQCAQVLTAHAAANWIHLPNGSLEPLGPVPAASARSQGEAHLAATTSQPAHNSAAGSAAGPQEPIRPSSSAAGRTPPGRPPPSETLQGAPKTSASHRPAAVPPERPNSSPPAQSTHRSLRPGSSQQLPLDLSSRPPFDNIKVVKPHPEGPPAGGQPKAGALTGRTAGKDRAVLGEVQEQGGSQQEGTHRPREDFEDWQARKQLQRKLEALQARFKVWPCALACVAML